MEIISKVHKKCERCPHVDDCDEKRKVACGMMNLPEPMYETAAQAMTMPVAVEMLATHDFRRVQISPTQTITVDMEKMKKDLKRHIYKALGCPGLQFGG